MSVGHADAYDTVVPEAETKLVSGTDVTPGHMPVPVQAAQFGNVPDVFAAQPAHAVVPFLRGSGHESGTHDANDDGARVDAAM